MDDANEPKPKTPEEIKQEKFNAINKAIAEKDTEITKVEEDKNKILRAETKTLKELAEELAKSDNLESDDPAKLSKEERDKKELALKTQIAKRDKILEEKIEITRALRDERADLSNQITYINGTRFQYLDNIDAENSKVSVSLYGIIQRPGFIDDTLIATSKIEKYNKKRNNETGLEAVKQRLKEELIKDNTARIYREYNVYISEDEVEERPNLKKGQELSPKYLISEAAEKKKKPTGTVSAELKGSIKDTFNPNGKKIDESIIFTEVVGKTNDISKIALANRPGMAESNKFESNKNTPFNSTGIPAEPTGNSVINNQFNNNNTLNSLTQNSKQPAAESSSTNLFKQTLKSSISTEIQTQKNWENQLTTGKDQESHPVTEKDRAIIKEKIKETQTRISESIKIYNEIIKPDEAKLNEKDIRASATDSAVNILKKDGSVTNNDNSSNNTGGSYNSVENKITSGASTGLAELLNPKKKDRYLKRNEASSPEASTEAGTEASTEASESSTAAVTAEGTAVATAEDNNDYDINRLMDLIGNSFKPLVETPDGTETEVKKTQQLGSSAIKQLTKDNSKDLVTTSNKILKETKETNKITAGMNQGQQASINNNNNITGDNNTKIANNSITGQPNQQPNPESTAVAQSEVIDYTPYFIKLTNAQNSMNDLLSSKLKVTIVS